MTVVTPSKAPPTAAAEGPAAVRKVVDVLKGFSIEATRPRPHDFTAIADTAPLGTQVYLSAIVTRPSSQLADQAVLARKAGLEPVPHIAVRNFASKEELSALLDRLNREASVRRALVISGDRADPLGPYTAAIDVIESGILQHHGITDVAIAGHPDGHPLVSDDVMERALLAKIETAEQSGLKADIVTQFGFDPGAMIRWVRKLRDLGVECPVRIGMAGPTSLTTLLRYAQRCGVKASAGGLARNVGLVKHLFGTSAPDGIVRALAQENAKGSLGDVAAHFFSFGGIGATAHWAAHAAQGRIALDGDGFSVEQ